MSSAELNEEKVTAALNELDEAAQLVGASAMFSEGGTNVTQLDLTLLDEQQLDQAKEELSLALQKHAEAERKVLDAKNEYVSEGLEEKVEKYGRVLTMKSKTYFFWQKAARIPKDLKYTSVFGEDKTWMQLVKDNESKIKFILNGEKVNDVDKPTWKKVKNSKGVYLETSPYYSDYVDPSKSSTLYRLRTTITAKPKEILLVMLRLELLGKHDADMLYSREHYNFAGGKTFLFHNVRNISDSKNVAARDDTALINWSEEADGVEGREKILVSSQSLSGVLKGMHKAGVVRGETLLEGFVLQETATGSTEVTFLVQGKPGGWVPKWTLSWFVPDKLIERLRSVAAAAEDVARGTVEEKENMIGKYVFREIQE